VGCALAEEEGMSRSTSARFVAGALVVALTAAPSPAADTVATPSGRDAETGWIVHQAANPDPTAAYRWLEIVLEASARSVDRIGARPPILAREMAIALTAMYDAWAAFDATAVGTRLGGALRRPAHERTPANVEQAIGYATYRALLYVYPEDTPWLAARMREAGLDPGNTTTDRSTPAGVGNVAAAAVIAYRRHDGANQHGDEVGSSGAPYSDYTYYEPRNPRDRIADPDRWQEIPFDDGKGGSVYLGFLTPHWYRVKPFALERSDQFRPGPCPKVGTPELAKDVAQCVEYNGNLTLEQKAIVEFMRDGPRSTGQSGHWLRFAQDVSRRDRNDLERDVQLFFSVANVVSDAFIACWEAKRHYDTSRPWTLVRHLYGTQKISGYRGPCKGVSSIGADRWHPYSPAAFVTPPFPGYPSGHSSASGAAARMLALLTGSDRYEAVAFRNAGELTEADCELRLMQARNGTPFTGGPTSTRVKLELPTFSATAEMAGISRVMGGYHIQADNVAGLALGRQLADYSWPRYRAYFEGGAQPRD
jgi:hypothetical protein